MNIVSHILLIALGCMLNKAKTLPLHLVSTAVNAHQTCNKENLKKCLSSLEYLVLNQFDGRNKTQKDRSLYCRTLEIAGQCLERVPVKCEKEYPKILNLMSTFRTHISQLCNDEGQLYMEIALCVENYAMEFGNCWSHQRTKRSENNEGFDDICTEIDSMKCVADLGRKKCRNGESFGNDLELYAERLKSDVCSSAAVLGKYFEILSVIVFSLFLARITF